MFQEEYSAESLRDTLDKMADGGEQLGALREGTTMTEDQRIATEEKQVNNRSKDQLNTLRKDQLTTTLQDQLTTSKTDQLTTISQDRLTTTWKRLWRKAIAGKNSVPI
jgi:hypothetical protein